MTGAGAEGAFAVFGTAVAPKDTAQREAIVPKQWQTLGQQKKPHDPLSVHPSMIHPLLFFVVMGKCPGK